MKKKKVIMVCADCKSTDVKRDAWAVWDVDEQKWDLETTFDEFYCGNCDGECHVEEITDLNEARTVFNKLPGDKDVEHCDTCKQTIKEGQEFIQNPYGYFCSGICEQEYLAKRREKESNRSKNEI